MAYITVTTPIDVVAPGDGKLSLREAVAKANATVAPDTIVFAADIAGMTLTLTQGELQVTQDLAIDGDQDNNDNAVTIDGNANGRILRTSRVGTNLTLENLVLTAGRATERGVGGANGGAIFIGGGSLAMARCIVSNSKTDYYGQGGGIFGEPGSRLSILTSSIVGNHAYAGGKGGAIAGYELTVTIRGSRISENISSTDGGGLSLVSSLLVVEDSTVSGNSAKGAGHYEMGGGIRVIDSTTYIAGSTIAGNTATYGGAGLHINGGHTVISDSTIAANRTDEYRVAGGVYVEDSLLVIRNSTITGNGIHHGGGIVANSARLDLTNSIVAGNRADPGAGPAPPDPDISGVIDFSNGHNVFGSNVAGNIPGDRENVAPDAIFAAIDPTTGGGALSTGGTVALRNNVANPALSAGDPILANVFDQRGATRPRPGGTLPDLGAVELNQPLSTRASGNNDQLTGTNAANKLTGFDGADYLEGLGGNDTLEGGRESDLLDGGPGNDTLQGGLGLDLAAYPGTAGVIIDLSGTVDTAKRGAEKDTLIGIEGALGSNAADTFKGDDLNNEFQGKTGKDTMTGGGGRDSWDFNDVADSPAGATRDLVTDFAPGQDIIDLTGVDADSTVPGNQSFRWVAKAESHRRGTARLFRQRRHDHRARQHRRRCGSRTRDPAHWDEDADGG